MKLIPPLWCICIPSILSVNDHVAAPQLPFKVLRATWETWAAHGGEKRGRDISFRTATEPLKGHRKTKNIDPNGGWIEAQKKEHINWISMTCWALWNEIQEVMKELSELERKKKALESEAGLWMPKRKYNWN